MESTTVSAILMECQLLNESVGHLNYGLGVAVGAIIALIIWIQLGRMH
jgi:hypothetical protein